jgi:hypothetical protein
MRWSHERSDELSREFSHVAEADKAIAAATARGEAQIDVSSHVPQRVQAADRRRSADAVEPLPRGVTRLTVDRLAPALDAQPGSAVPSAAAMVPSRTHREDEGRSQMHAATRVRPVFAPFGSGSGLLSTR